MIEAQNETRLVLPDVEQAAYAMKKFQEIKSRILDENDVVKIQGKTYTKRSGWRKIALAFNIRTEVLGIEREHVDDVMIIRVRARATANNGRYSDEVAVCDSSEFTGNLKPTLHNIETKAVTRAVNRAISDLVGGGEVSAEEIETTAVNDTAQAHHDKERSNENLITSKQLNAVRTALEGKQEKYGDYFLEYLDSKEPDLVKYIRERGGFTVERMPRDKASRLLEILWKSSENDQDFQNWLKWRKEVIVR